MAILKHGISIGIRRIDNEFYMTLVVVGKLTHEDYKTLTPMIGSALEGVTAPKIKMLVDVTQLEGWELRAAWDDFKIGLKHGNQFERIAMVGNKPWQEWAAKVAGWFTSAKIEYFEDEVAAITWLQS